MNASIDCDKYRVNFEYIKQLLAQADSDTDRFNLISRLSVATSVPIIVVASYYGEIYGFTDELKLMIDKLKDFYDIKEVTGVKV